MTSQAVERPPVHQAQPRRSRRPRSGATWFWPALLTVVGLSGLLRFWRLDRPHQLVFDETYYVKQGYSLLKVGYELQWAGDGKVVDPKWNAGDVNIFTDQPDFVVHPPVGKWMIGFGEWLFGPTSSWGWRFSAAVVGTLSLLMIGLIARRLFGSPLLGVLAALLLAVDGQHYVHSRTGLLDVFVMFWALAAFGCLLIDRDVGRRRLAERLSQRPPPPGGVTEGLGPWLGVRWWRVAAGVCLGLCIGTKWSGLYFAAAFGLMAVCWDAAARRRAGVRRWFAGGLLRDGVPAFVVLAATALVTYLVSWTGWFLSRDAYDRQWGAQHSSARYGWVPDALRSLWYYHSQMLHFHTTLMSDHPYKANPWSWIVLGRPTFFYYEDPKLGEKGCRVAQCSQAIDALGNPVIWWGGTLAIGVLLFQWALRRDWRAGAVLAGVVGGYLPWFAFQQRTVYDFYAIAFTPWVVLSLTYVLGMLLGPPGLAEPHRRRRAIAAGAVVVVAVGVFAFFLPILSAQVIPQTNWSDRMWLPSWV